MTSSISPRVKRSFFAACLLLLEVPLMSLSDDARYLALIDALPDRSAQIQKILPDERFKDARSFPPDGAPYKMVAIYRSPPTPCSTGEHRVPVADVTLVTLSGKKVDTFKIDEDHLHEIKFHGASFTTEESAILAKLAARVPEKK